MTMPAVRRGCAALSKASGTSSINTVSPCITRLAGSDQAPFQSVICHAAPSEAARAQVVSVVVWTQDRPWRSVVIASSTVSPGA